MVFIGPRGHLFLFEVRIRTFYTSSECGEVLTNIHLSECGEVLTNIHFSQSGDEGYLDKEKQVNVCNFCGKSFPSNSSLKVGP